MYFVPIIDIVKGVINLSMEPSLEHGLMFLSECASTWFPSQVPRSTSSSLSISGLCPICSLSDILKQELPQQTSAKSFFKSLYISVYFHYCITDNKGIVHRYLDDRLLFFFFLMKVVIPYSSSYKRLRHKQRKPLKCVSKRFANVSIRHKRFSDVYRNRERTLHILLTLNPILHVLAMMNGIVRTWS